MLCVQVNMSTEGHDVSMMTHEFKFQQFKKSLIQFAYTKQWDITNQQLITNQSKLGN